MKTVNDEVRVQALIDGMKVTIKESSIRRTLRLVMQRVHRVYPMMTFLLVWLTWVMRRCLTSSPSTRLSSYPNRSFSSILSCNALVLKPPLGMNLAALWHQQLSVLQQTRSLTSSVDHQLGDISHHKDIYDNPSLTKKVFANMKRVDTGFSRVITPLFESMLVQAVEEVGEAQDDVSIPTEPSTSKPQKKHKLKKQQPKAPKVPSPIPSPEHQLPPPSYDLIPTAKDSLTLHVLMDFCTLCTRLSNKVLDLESEVIDIKSSFTDRIQKLEDIVDQLKEENRVLKEKSFRTTQIATAAPVEDMEKSFKHERMKVNMDEDVEEVQAKVYNLDLQHAEKVLSMQDTDEEEPAKMEEVLEVVKAAKLMTEVVTNAQPTTNAAQVPKPSAPRRRRGVVIQDPKETATSVIMHSELEAELNANINWNDVIEQVKRSEKQDNTVMRYQALKRKPVTKAQARKNMMIYLKNMAGFKMDFFKGMTYSEIRPIFEKHYNSIQAFLEKEDKENFDREDLEALWKLVKERFEAAEPKNFSYDFLINTLKIMFKKPNVEANMILLVEKKYPLTHFTLQQMLDNVRLEVKEESDMSLELLRLYLMRRSLEVLRKFHCMIPGGRFNKLSHVSSLLLSKPGSTSFLYLLSFLFIRFTSTFKNIRDNVQLKYMGK
uniref:Uncharacterized protein n=1 Tax=Tanacetum cinerariifolium TaxID=118510 RepID=A0A699IYY1_TANCI|nr:hypothetical protein [Tanacetum cinerariifolium]